MSAITVAIRSLANAPTEFAAIDLGKRLDLDATSFRHASDLYVCAGNELVE
jgi:hypothetical protein